ncbi:MAG: acyl-CoA dehydrogenase family protein [Notoacmeibacter sp.]|nr:acyl-CoA dehydrogenase family protein [Notoacmeibacter sp.]MCC0031730.1 acyl-CoA dehydrogenase family protein [Brucellaceae bacterium]
MATHEVTNQSPVWTGGNAWRHDPLLVQLTEDFDPAVRKELDQIGRFVLSAEAQETARIANTLTPVLRTHDRQGHRLDQVDYHPAYHALMRRSVASGLHSSVWENIEAEKGMRHRTRAARFYLMSQLECGHLCPVTMTSASLAPLLASPALFREWAPRITSRKYDSANRPPVEKSGLTLGMGMTEKQGGTDVRANTTRAEPLGNDFYRLTGHKWFMSAPMSDAFLVLAQAPEGLTCFLAPRILGDGKPNGFRFQRLKDKLGNRSNGSSEVEFDGVIAQLVGVPGEGVKTIMDMVTLTRLDCALASSGLMRAGLSEAVHHARHRRVFGKPLAKQPLMIRVLADLALDTAAAGALAMRLARSFDEAGQDDLAAAWSRVMTPVVKYWVCKMAPPMIYEMMECLGGNGYVEEGNLARHYREAPVNAIWEGSGNVMALDLLRVLRRSPGQLDLVIDGLAADLGAAGHGTIDVLRAAAQVAASDEGSARILIEQLALAAAAAELFRIGAGRIAGAFMETRLGGQWRGTYGMLDARHDAGLIVETLYPDAG